MDKELVAKLGDSFEGTVESRASCITSLIILGPLQSMSKTSVRLNEAPVGLKDLVGLVKLPAEIDSVSYIRSVRDAE